MIKNPTFGSDAEMFVKSIADKSVFPVCGLLGGTKEAPKSMGGGGFFVQEDNVLLEFNIPPAKAESAFIKNMQIGVTRAKKLLPPTLYAEACASANINPAFLNIDQACVFGCDPDFNVWTRRVNPRPKASDPTFRTAAAHVHIGWDNPVVEDQENLIRAADLFVSIPSVLEDKDKKRRELYGKAGAFRFKPYGVEHRVLSNYWIDSGTAQISYVIQRYLVAIDFVNRNEKKKTPLFSESEASQIQEAINTCNSDLAGALMRKYSLY